MVFLLLLQPPLSAFQDISGTLSPLLENSSVPSLAAAAVVDGEIAAAGAAGVRKAGSPDRVLVTDRYHIGSCGKSMTATLAALLVEEGKIGWQTTLGRVFEDFDLHEGYAKATLHQLLTNTGGAPEQVRPLLWAELWNAEGPPKEQRLQLVKGVASKPPAYEAGSGYAYSNAGFALAGAMLEEVTGESYEDLLSDKLFKPLGMASAGFGAPASEGKVDQPYGHVGKGEGVVPVDPVPRGDNPAAIAPAGTVHCSVLDFAEYARFHLGASERLPDKADLRMLHQPVRRDYAMGWRVVERKWAGGRALTHVGSNTMFHAVIWIAPEKNFAAVAMCNDGREEGFRKCDEAIGLLIRTYLNRD